MWSGSDAEKAAWQHVADLVTTKYPDIKVQLDTAAWPDYWTKLPTLAASNTLPDIVSLQSLRAPGFASLMVPLDDMIKRDKFDIDAFDKSIVGGLSHDGKVFALPYDFGPLLVYYNADLFAKAGLPVPQAGLDGRRFHQGRQGADHGQPVRHQPRRRRPGGRLGGFRRRALHEGQRPRPHQSEVRRRLPVLRRPGRQGEGGAAAGRRAAICRWATSAAAVSPPATWP